MLEWQPIWPHRRHFLSSLMRGALVGDLHWITAVAEESSHPFQALLHPCPSGSSLPLEELLLLVVAWEAGDSEVSRQKAAGISSWLMAAEKGRPWRVQWTSALSYQRGQCRGDHHTSKVCPFLLLFSRRLSVPRFFLHCLAASLRALLSVARAIHCRSEEIFPVG